MMCKLFDYIKLDLMVYNSIYKRINYDDSL